MQGKRGQFTIFVILGIVLVGTFGFMLFARNIIVQTQLKIKADRIVNEVLQTTSINHYVTSCLDRVTDEAVVLLGLQGGVLYQHQGGIIPLGVEGEDYLPFEYNGTVYNVSYALRINRNNSCLDVSPPGYPFWNTYLMFVKTDYQRKNEFGVVCSITHSGAFGQNSLSKLCDPRGPNRHLISPRYNYSCGGNESYDINSIQFQLTKYISNKTAECADFSVFKDVFGYNITVLNQPNTNLTFGNNGFTVETTYPFVVKVGASDVRRFVKFDIKKNYRLKELYEYIVRLLREEASDFTFNLHGDFQDVFGGDDANIDVIARPNSCFACVNNIFDDVIQIIDNASRINGNPFVFHFAIENRIPALDYIDEGWTTHNIQVMEGYAIEFYPEGYDPDENILNYTYHDWKEDFDSNFNIACCSADLADCQANPGKCVDIDYSKSPKNWTGSDLYNDTHQNASYVTNFNDTGLHYVTIMIEDEEGLKDWQNISILVFDLPLAVAAFSNPYSDIGDRNASVEDPYVLDASLSHAFLSDITRFRWNDSVEPFKIETGDPTYILPDSPYDIETIPPLRFFVLGTHEISLEVLTPNFGWAYPPDVEEITVHECLPHRNAGDPYPYPYSQDSFQAEHVCCGNTTDGFNWGEIVSMNGKVCFAAETEYGANRSFTNLHLSDYTNPDILPSNPRTINYDTSTNSDGDIENDIFKREMERKCDGTRGNMCTGDITELRTVLYDCATYTSSEDERCEGPTNSNAVTTPIGSCTQYSPGNSFEKLFGLLDRNGGIANGVCNENEVCSTIGPNGHGMGIDKVFLCNATCNSGSCSNTRFNECRCALSCGASCEHHDDSKLDALNNKCSYGCRLTGDCKWAQSEDCPLYCIDDNDGGPCQQTRHNPSSLETCNFGRGCNHPSGCGLGLNSDLRQDYCDYCTSSGSIMGANSSAPTTPCSGGCAHSGTIYYDDGGTYADRSDDCLPNGNTNIKTDPLTMGDVWDGNNPAKCDNTECSNDCINDPNNTNTGGSCDTNGDCQCVSA